MAKYSYHGNRKPYAAVLCHSGDLPVMEPVFDEIEKKGLRLCLIDEKAGKPGARLKKACGVICVLTENFSRDEAENLQSGILEAEAAGKSVIPLRADGFDLPDFIKRMTYASNSINISKYTPEKAAERILTAPVLAEPKLTKEQAGAYKRTIALTVAAALVIAAAVAVPLIRDRIAGPEPVGELGELAINLPDSWDLTEEDLENISCVILTGNRLEDADLFSGTGDFVYGSWENGKTVWRRNEDGSEVERGSITDLSFLSRFTNLQQLILINQTAEEFPDLTGLDRLNKVLLFDCAFKNIEGIGAGHLREVYLTLPELSDLSPLSACPELETVSCTGCTSLRTLEGFCPPRLRELEILGPLEDLSAVSELKRLTNLTLRINGSNTPSDLSPLSGCAALTDLVIEAYGNMDFAPLSGLSQLSSFDCSCRSAGNIDALARPGLTRFSLSLDYRQAADLSFLASCTRLSELSLRNINTNLDFLYDTGRGNMSRVELEGSGINCAGLSALKSVGELQLNTGGMSPETALTALSNININRLQLSNCGTFPASAIPQNVTELVIEECGVSSLEGLSAGKMTALTLRSMNRLSSLKGLENSNITSLTLDGCMRLTDWDALYGLTLKKIEIRNQLSLPDFGRTAFQPYAEIRLENIPGMTDLSCLDAISDETLAGTVFSVGAVSGEIVNLNALSRFNGKAVSSSFGLRLTVHPAVEDQARELVSRGVFGSFALEYPQGSWENVYNNYTVLSYDELYSLPEAVLSKIKNLFIIGDGLYENSGWCDCEDHNGRREYSFSPEASDGRIPVTGQGPVTDFSVLSKMTGLEDLILMCQPLKSLDGIQNLENLRKLCIYGCENISDYSPVFALGSLEELRLEGEKITSIEGIQNLYSLRSLNLRDTYVADLSPIGGISFSEEVYENGFSLTLPSGIRPEDGDYSFLAAVPKYDRLEMFTAADGSWTEYLRGREVREAHIFCMNDTQTLENFVSAVTGLRYLKISWQPGIDSLECLLECDSLETLVLTHDMKNAVKSLDGRECRFITEFED